MTSSSSHVSNRIARPKVPSNNDHDDQGDVSAETIFEYIDYFTSPANALSPSQAPHQHRVKSSIWLSVVISLFTIVFLAQSVVSYVAPYSESRLCNMSYMTPSYMKLTGLDANHTRLSSKYSLYLYREQNVDSESELNGVPVIFIPGNAGSFRQVRSFAAETATQYQALRAAWLDNDGSKDNYKRGLDFFTADFSEDLTAFDGQAMLDQAEYVNDAIEYVLSLYKRPFHRNLKTNGRADYNSLRYPLPTSVILIGHSMGGMVARTMFLMSNYRRDSVNTVLTFAAPHTQPPTSFDRNIVAIYESTNRYWEESFSQQLIGRNPLAYVSLISITGGGLDQMIASDHGGVSSFVPPSNGFSVFTNSIPTVWSGIDHQAIVWCDQLRQVVVKALLEIVDARSSTRTKPLADRMNIFRQYLLTGMEMANAAVSESSLSRLAWSPDTLLLVDDIGKSILPLSRRFRTDKLGSPKGKAVHLMAIQPNNGSSSSFTLTTSHTLLIPSRFSTVDVNNLHDLESDLEKGLYALACRYPKSAEDLSDTLFSVLDLRESRSQKRMTGLICRNIAADHSSLPKASSPVMPLSPPSSDSSTTYIHYNLTELKNYDFIAVIDSNDDSTPGYVMAGIDENQNVFHDVKVSTWKLLLGGSKSIKLPPAPPIMIDISLISVWSSLLEYKAEILGEGDKWNEVNFLPFMRQYIDDPYESKFYLNLVPGRQLYINFHGVAPFTPFNIRDESVENSYNNLHLQIFTDTNSRGLHLKLKIDYWGSLRRLALHYRTSLVAFPLAIVSLVLLIQFDVYSKTSDFIRFQDGLHIFMQSYLVWVLVFSFVFPLSVNLPFMEKLLYFIEPSLDYSIREGPQSVFTSTRRSKFFLGLEKNQLLMLGPILIVVSAGIIQVTLTFVTFIMHVLSWILESGQHLFSNKSHENRAGGHPPVRRIIMTLLLLLVIAFYVPYQFAILVVILVQLFAGIRIAAKIRRSKRELLLQQAKNARDSDKPNVNDNDNPTNVEESEIALHNLYHFTVSILMMMIWILPASVPTLAVWAHNLSVNWTMPFKSYHNLFAIAPIICLTERIASSRMIPRMIALSQQLFTRLMLVYVCLYSLIFGIQRSFWLHHLVNFFCMWLLLIYVEDIGFLRREVVQVILLKERTGRGRV